MKRLFKNKFANQLGLGLLVAFFLGGSAYFANQYAKKQALISENQEAQLNYEKFLREHPYSNRKYKNKEQYKAAGLPRRDRPDWAMEQDFRRTFDPATGKVPSERLFAETEKLQKYFKNNKGGRTEAATAANWIERGPNNIGGRTRAIMFDPNDVTKKKVWAGAVAGGMWYNNDITDVNSSWIKISDLWNNMAISALAYDPSNTQVFYAGTGEGWFNVDAVRGEGIWKTTDGGVTWNRLTSTITNFLRVTKIVVTSAGVVLATDRNNGVFRSTDGGTTWTSLMGAGVGQIPTGERGADLEIAANGDIYCTTGIFTTGKIYKSVNNGVTWTNLNYGTATGTPGRIEIACAPSNANILYAVCHNSAATGSTDVSFFKKSTDAGATWANVTMPMYRNQNCTVSTNHFTRAQAWYDLILSVHPTDPNTVFAGGIDIHRTTNGGTSWSPVSYWTGNCYSYVHADIHNIIFRPTDVNTLMVACDVGIFYSNNANAGTPAFAARNKNYNVTQFYAAAMKNIATDPFLVAGAQDNGSLAITAVGIKRVRDGAEATGGDGAFCFVDQTDPNIVITAYTNNVYYKSTDGGGSFSALGTQDGNTGDFINAAEYDPVNKVLYSWNTADSYSRWAVPAGTRVSPQPTGTGNHTAYKLSPYTSGTLFIGNDVGKVYKVTNAHSRNANPAFTPTDVTPSGALATGTVSSIEVGASENELLVTLSNYGIKSVFYTSNGGTTWTSKDEVAYGLPDVPVRWCLMNPSNRQEVLLATELGVWATDNITAANPNWVPVNTTLANTRIDMLKYRSADGLVLAATHGRGLFVSDVFAFPSVGFYAENNEETHPFAAKNTFVFYENSTIPVAFYDNSLKATSYSWNFGAGATPATATTEGPHNVTYSSIGKKTVSLSINAGALTSTQTDYLHILPYKTAPYTP
jgi:photosystem II stability/assembly factor-like uncharacterized protein